MQILFFCLVAIPLTIICGYSLQQSLDLASQAGTERLWQGLLTLAKSVLFFLNCFLVALIMGGSMAGPWQMLIAAYAYVAIWVYACRKDLSVEYELFRSGT